MVDARTDADLLSAVREGNERAYAVLWERHFPAARRYAHRLFAARADDLVSESFLAIYQQVTTTGAGPRFASAQHGHAVVSGFAVDLSHAERVPLIQRSAPDGPRGDG